MENRAKKLKKAILAIAVTAAISILARPFVAVPEMEKRQSVDIVDKRVGGSLERAKDRIRAMRFVPVVVSAYNPVVAQTDSTPEITASNKRVRGGMVALSRDLEKEYGFTFGDTVVIEGHGSFAFEDRMSKRWSRRVDILMFSREAAREFGVQHSFLVVSD